MDGRDSPPIEQARPIRRPALWRALVAGAVTAVLLAAGVEIYSISIGGNLHEVIPGGVYRCRQPTLERLEAYVQHYGIRTVINLRGIDVGQCYLEESRATAQLDLSEEDLPFTAGRLPSVPVIRHLLQVFDQSEWPILIHCRQGVDRTGMASAMALLLYTDAGLDQALRQLGPRYGHLPFGRTGNIDRFFELYREWLAEKGWTHTREHFRYWVEFDYCPGECVASFEVLEPKGKPIVARLGVPLAVRVRCTNQSVKPWRFRPGANAGIHLCWDVLDGDDQSLFSGRSGLFDAVVLPQKAIDLTLAIPAQSQPGRYRLRIDMADEQHGHFCQLGREPFIVELEVKRSP